MLISETVTITMVLLVVVFSSSASTDDLAINQAYTRKCWYVSESCLTFYITLTSDIMALEG